MTDNSYFGLNCFMSNFCFIKTSQIDEHLEDPYHIYFIISMKKSYFVENSIHISNVGIKCKIEKNGQLIDLKKVLSRQLDGGIISSIDYSLSNDKSTLKIEYYRDFFKKELLFMTANEAYEASGLCERLVCNILYIGQSFGKEGKRTAAQRLKNHEVLQAIFSDIENYGADEEVLCLLSDFAMDSKLVLRPGTSNIDIEKLTFNFLDCHNKWAKKNCIDITEAGLINCFKPKYNDIYKNNIYRNEKNSKFKNLYSNNVDRITIEFSPEYEKNDILNGTFIKMPLIILKTEYAELNTSDYNSIIQCDLNENGLKKAIIVNSE